MDFSLSTSWNQHLKLDGAGTPSLNFLERLLARTDCNSLPDLKEQSNTHGSNVLDVLWSMDDGSIPEQSRRGMYTSQCVPIWKSMRASSITLSYKYLQSMGGGPKAAYYIKSLDDNILSRWGILYCGGNKMVAKSLKAVSEAYHIYLHTESFQW